MDIKIKMSQRKVFYVVLASILCYLGDACNNSSSTKKAAAQVQVPGFFVFGDSLVDNGNNNNILTLARANYQPYGIDYPRGPTGRFCNGKTVADALAELLGFADEIPSFSAARRNAYSRGVNFASGAAGIRDETGNNLGAHIPLGQQVSNFARVAREIRRSFRGDANAFQNYMSKCIFFCGLGSNDYLNNYFMTDYYSTSSQFTPEAYANALIQDYSRQVSVLYQLGARKVIITGIGQIGCIPYELARSNGTSQSRCDEDKNNAISIFNTGLRQLVDGANNGQLAGSKFVYLDSFLASKDLYSKPSSFGLEIVDKGCCGVGKNNGQITCLPLQSPCENRDKYLFWDAFHPTEAANIQLAKEAYTSNSKSYAYPINVQQLAAL